MKKFAFLFSILFTVTTATFAQTTSEEAAYRAEFKKMAAKTQLQQGFCKEMKTMLDQMYPSKLNDAEREAIVKEINERIGDRYMEDACEMWKKIYSLEDMKNLNAFYSTPTGEKIGTTAYPLLQQSVNQSYQYSNDVVEVLQKYLSKSSTSI